MIMKIIKKISGMNGAKAMVKIMRNRECIATVEVTVTGLELEPHMIEKTCTAGLIALTKLDRYDRIHKD